jgi:hypothetical protein
MKKNIKQEPDGISNLDFPIANVIREALDGLSPDERLEVLETMSEDEFIHHRVDMYLHELENAMHQGLDELGAKEIALRECLAGIIASNG